jgi:trehalose 6-phosphate synthase
MTSVLIANIRGPVSFAWGEDGTLSASRGGGGVVSGLSSVVERGDALWICAAQNDADRAAAARTPDGRLGLDGSPGGSDVRMLDIPAETFQRAHYGVANSVLWYLHHMLYQVPRQPQFGAEFRLEWESFRDYNRAFATALAAEAGRPAGNRAAAGNGAAAPAGGAGNGRVLASVQDYHLSLVPRLLSDLRPDIKIAHFTHTPWAPAAYYRMLPEQTGRELLEGVLGADHAGFHCQRWADAFLDCCAEILGADVDRDRQRVTHDGHVTGVGVHALGVDAAGLRDRGSQPDVQVKVDALAGATAGRKLIVRIDRTELSKNILRGLAAYRELLLAHPEWRGRVTHLAFSYPSRQNLAEYREYMADVQRLAGQIREEFGTADWEPLTLEVRDDYPRSLAACRLADVLLVNPVRDGMNLVAKEGPILSDRGCALVLSQEAGAAAELGGHAIMINPFDVSGTAQALHEALTLSDAERGRRGAALAAAAAGIDPARWLAGQLAALG